LSRRRSAALRWCLLSERGKPRLEARLFVSTTSPLASGAGTGAAARPGAAGGGSATRAFGCKSSSARSSCTAARALAVGEGGGDGGFSRPDGSSLDAIRAFRTALPTSTPEYLDDMARVCQGQVCFPKAAKFAFYSERAVLLWKTYFHSAPCPRPM